MTARKLMITTGAIFALAAPVAQASLARTLPVKVQFATHHKIVVAKNHKVAAKTTTAKHKASTGPLYILVPGTPNQAVGVPSPDDCANTGANCTDQQLCDIWGENCDSIGSMTNDAPPVAPAPDATLQTDPTTNAAPSVDTTTSDSSTTDSSATDNSDEC